LGPNGAGKSTLLKLLARISKPTSGCIKIRGRIAAILGIGAGFSSELTGRENVYLYATLLGMKRKEISQKFDEIVAFADIGPFLDTPIKKYSNGMKVRLAFAVATHIPTDLLLLDEVLKVGDAVFQKKCIAKIQELIEQGVSTIMVTHSFSGLQEICKRGIYLKAGSIIKDGPIQEVIETYQKL